MTSIIANRYVMLDKLGEGGMGMVFRAHDRLTGTTVALKQVTATPADLRFATRSQTNNAALALALEFRTLASLRHPNIVSVDDYGFDGERPFYTMQIVEGARTLTAYGVDCALGERVRLLTETLQALAYLHRRQIIHRDLKPANVLVTQDGAVKMLDFGLALAQHSAEGTPIMGVVGTLNYMAPELFVQETATVQSDLYAVGVMMYEMFAGHYPFEVTSDSARLINHILYTTPDTLPFELNVARLLDRLLAKDPAQRPVSAEAVIAELCAATGQPLPQESAAIRESFLRASQFVSRQTELWQLTTALREAVGGRGSAWLVGGESGVGKSRLLDEIRTRALVDGVLVLRGQAAAEGGLTYQVWREPVLRLILAVEPSDFEASVLKELVPDIAQRLGRYVVDAPRLRGADSQQRLAATIAALFQRSQQPILLLLEDLHWAAESLIPLQTLLSLHEQRRHLLILGTYRDDERPDLPAHLPAMTLLRLTRFDSEAVAALSVSMLGEAGRSAALVDWLTEETEGNAFFIVEVVRALAEEAGRLSEVGSRTLPRGVVAGGMKQVIQRRLAKVPEDAQSLLKLAAVVGRQLDGRVLGDLLAAGVAAPLDVGDLERWLTLCVNAAVLERADGELRFAHDKLRETLITALDADERRLLNRAVAASLERVYAGDSSAAVRLVEHFAEAGDDAKQRHYSRIGAEALLATSTFQAAVILLERAVERFPSDYVLRRMLGEACIWLQRYDDATLAFTVSLAMAEAAADEREAAFSLLGLGHGAVLQTRLTEARAFLERSRTLCERLEEVRGLAMTHLLLTSIERRQGNFSASERHLAHSLALYRQLNDTAGIAEVNLSYGFLYGEQGYNDRAMRHYEAALTAFTELGNQQGVATAQSGLGMVANARQQLDQALAYMQGALEAYRSIGNRWGVEVMLGNIGLIYHRKRELAQAEHYMQRGLALAREIAHDFDIANTLVNIGFLWLDLDKLEQAEAAMREAVALAQRLGVVSPVLEALVGFAQLFVRRGEYVRAVRLLTFVDADVRTDADVRHTRLEPVQYALEELMPPSALALAHEQGRRLSLEAALAEALGTPAS